MDTHKYYNCCTFRCGSRPTSSRLAAERLALRSLTRCTTSGRPTERAAMDASQEIEEYPSDRGQVLPRSPGSRITNASKTLPDVDVAAPLPEFHDPCIAPVCIPAISLQSR